jgi:hypothetical protein
MIGRVRLIQKGRTALPRIHIVDTDTGETIKAKDRGDDFRDFAIQADACLTITWS